MLRSLRVQSAFAWGNAWRRSRSSRFSPLQYGAFKDLCIAFHLTTVCSTEKHGVWYWVSMVMLDIYTACMQASMRPIATGSRDERTPELGTPYFLITPLVVFSDFL